MKLRDVVRIVWRADSKWVGRQEANRVATKGSGQTPAPLRKRLSKIFGTGCDGGNACFGPARHAPLHSALPLPPFSLTAKLSCSVSDDDFRFLEYCDRFPRRLSHCVDCADFDPAKGGATGINRRGLPKITAFIRDITAWIIPVSRAGDFPKGFFSRGQWRNLLPALCPL